MSCSSAQQDASAQQDSVVKGGESSAGHNWVVEGDEIRGVWMGIESWYFEGTDFCENYSEFVFNICPFLVRKDRCYLIEIAPSASGVIRPSINVN